MGETFPQNRIPRFTPEDARDACLEFSGSPVTENVNFGDIYQNRTASAMTPVEEGIASHWHTDKIVLLGDAAHKVLILY